MTDDGLTEADDTLDDDCTCPPGCDHGPSPGDAGTGCDVGCPVHANA